MKNFIVGLIVGLFILFYFYLFHHSDPTFRVEMGKLLDQDTVYFKDGKIMRGYIFDKNDEGIFIEVENSHFTLPYSLIRHIEENTLTKFVKELI